MYCCVTVYKAAIDFTILRQQTREQRADLSSSLIERSNQDITNKPFNTEEPMLKSLSTGITAWVENDAIWNNAENVSEKIQIFPATMYVEKVLIK